MSLRLSAIRPLTASDHSAVPTKGSKQVDKQTGKASKEQGGRGRGTRKLWARVTLTQVRRLRAGLMGSAAGDSRAS